MHGRRRLRLLRHRGRLLGGHGVLQAEGGVYGCHKLPVISREEGKYEMPCERSVQLGIARSGSSLALSVGLALVACVSTVSLLACSGSASLDHGSDWDGGGSDSVAGSAGDASADGSDAAGQGGSNALDGGAEDDGYWDYDEPVQTDPWCAPPHEAAVEEAACCNDTPCYGQCARHSPEGSIVCECATVVGGCRSGTKCCSFVLGCVAADRPCPEGP